MERVIRFHGSKVAGKKGSLGTPDCVLSCLEAVLRMTTVLCSGQLGFSVYFLVIIKCSHDYPQRSSFAPDTVPNLMNV